jgi:D-3-phosphoglycerate dehydrogenase / 2-oxoglutarate reductase
VIISNPKEYAQHLADGGRSAGAQRRKGERGGAVEGAEAAVIGRAGVGVDNVDLKAATNAGVLVMNTPGGNAVSVAEHTLALMLAMARSIPQASNSTKGGKWEKKKFLGNELRGKTLGVVGLGSIGREVVKRARPFEMRIIASDPYVSSQTAADLGVELVPLWRCMRAADYLTLHVALTPETQA